MSVLQYFQSQTIFSKLYIVMSVQKMATAACRVRLFSMCGVMMLGVKSAMGLPSCHGAPRLNSFLSGDNASSVETCFWGLLLDFSLVCVGLYLNPWWPPQLLQRVPRPLVAFTTPAKLLPLSMTSGSSVCTSFVVHIKVGSESIYQVRYRAKTSGVTLRYK